MNIAIIAQACLTAVSCILFLNIVMLSLFLAKLSAFKNITAKATVLIPPAVDPGEPPISIRTYEANEPPSERLAWSKEAKPAVRRVTDSKNAFNHLSPSLK